MFEFEFDSATGASGGRLSGETGLIREWGMQSTAAADDDDDDGDAAAASAAHGAMNAIASNSVTPQRAPPILGYHFSMVNDVARASAFKRGLADTITPSSIVVDLGSGSGLLAVLAAKLGARHVFAIEQESSLAEVSRKVIADNGVSHCVTVINR